jgi:UDP-glucose 6-dehydrogenase
VLTLASVFAAADALAPHLTKSPCVIAGKSTVPVGTARQVMNAHTRDRPRLATQVGLAWNPEFLREGFAVQDSLDARPYRARSDVRAVPRRCCVQVYAGAAGGGQPGCW